MPTPNPRTRPKKPVSPKPSPRPAAARPDEDTTPAQEWGERIATGKAIARSGKKSGHVPGATEQQK